MDRGLVWFKRDLRVRDHAPLCDAASRGPVLGIYIYEPCVLRADEHDARHLEFVNESLKELRSDLQQLGSDLLIAEGDAVDVFERLWHTHAFARLHSHEETGLGQTFDRDKRVRSWCRERRVEWHEAKQHGVIRPHTSRDGWSRRWNGYMRQPECQTLEALSPWPNSKTLDLGDTRSPSELGVRELCDLSDRQRGGTQAGEDLLRTFLHERGETYQRAMSSPLEGADACSRLSPHLAYGTVSIRTASHAANERAADLRDAGGNGLWLRSIGSFQKRLRWHCHFIQKLESEPEIEFQNMHRGYDGMRVENEAQWNEADRHAYAAWCDGRTGYPFVDACMRSLNETGWLNFRMRSMLVSFAAYHLWLHWRPVARHLARAFTDFEPGIHYSQVQMQSGTTGINTVRIYNPVKQGRDQDPDGVFVRRWVPELAELPGDLVHVPWESADSLFSRTVDERAYPPRLVDHAPAYRAAQRRIFAVRKQSAVRDEARRVYIKHGSRRGGARLQYRGAPEDRGDR